VSRKIWQPLTFAAMTKSQLRECGLRLWQTKKRAFLFWRHFGRVCQILLGKTYQNGKKCTKWTQKLPKDPKIYQMDIYKL
jgi:hypothetical protein